MAAKFLTATDRGALRRLEEALQTAPVTLASSITNHGPQAAQILSDRIESMFPMLSGRLFVEFSAESEGYNISVVGSGAMEAVASEVTTAALDQISILNEDIANNLKDSITDAGI